MTKGTSAMPLSTLSQKAADTFSKNPFKIKPNVNIYIESDQFLIKSIDSWPEFISVLQFRNEVFVHEYTDKKKFLGIDIDYYDRTCDHLIIKDRKSNRLVGTYRLRSSKFTNRFYSQTEFDLGKILELDGHKMELGRACIHPDFRTGATIQLLWRGIAAYALATDSRYCFGCSSVKGTDPNAMKLYNQYFSLQGVLSQNYEVKPMQNGVWDGVMDQEAAKNLRMDPNEIRNIRRSLPNLLTVYLRFGAKILGAPVVDHELKCFDYFTLLDLYNMNEVLARKFGVDELCRSRR